MLDQTRLAPKHRHWNLIFQQVFKHWTQCNPPKTEQLDPYNGARDDAGELFWSRPNSSKSQGLFKKVQSVNQKKGSLIAFKKTAQCPTFLIYNMFIPKKNGGGKQSLFPPQLPPSKPNGHKKGCRVTKPMWISEIRRPSRRGVLTHPFRPGGFGLLFPRGEVVGFFRVVPLNERKLTFEKSTVIVGGIFCVVFFWDFDGCVFVGWMFRQSKMVPEISHVAFLLDEANWFARMTMIWVGGIVLLRGQWHLWVKPVFGWRIFSHAAQGELPAFIQLAQKF